MGKLFFAAFAAVVLFTTTPVTALSPEFTALQSGLYYVPDSDPGALYAVSDDGRYVAAYLEDGSTAGAIFLFDIETMSVQRIYTAQSEILHLWVDNKTVYFVEDIGASRAVFARADAGRRLELARDGYDYIPLFSCGLLFVCYDEPGDMIGSGYRVYPIPGDDNAGILPAAADITYRGYGCALAPLADPDGDGVYFAMSEEGETRLYRYDAPTNKISPSGIFGEPQGYAFGRRSLVVDDKGTLVVIEDGSFTSEGIAGGRPVAFFKGGSQTFVNDDAIRMGNLYEGKSSRIDFDWGTFYDVYLYPVSLTDLYVQLIRSDGAGDIYWVASSDEGVTVTPVAGSGLIVDTEGRFDYYGE